MDHAGQLLVRRLPQLPAGRRRTRSNSPPRRFFYGITHHPKDHYTALFTIESKASAARDTVDHIFRELLVHLHARDLRAIESYD